MYTPNRLNLSSKTVVTIYVPDLISCLSVFRVLHTKTPEDIETQLVSRNLERNLLVNFTPL